MNTADDTPAIYYVYELRDHEGRVFYVGKGKGDRVKSHRYCAKNPKHKNKLYYKIRKLWKLGYDYEVVRMMENLTEKVALTEEIKLIAHYGRANLTNLTDGGQGTSGTIISEERRAKLSLANKGKKRSAEVIAAMRLMRSGGLPQSTREAISRTLKGRKLSKETVEKMRGRKQSAESVEKRRLSNTGKVRTPELKTRMKEMMKGRIVSPEWKENMSKAHNGKALPQSTKDKIRVAMIVIANDPERKERLATHGRGRVVSQATKDKLREARTGKKLSEEHKKKLSDAKKGLKLSPERRAQIAASYTGNQWSKRKAS